MNKLILVAYIDVSNTDPIDVPRHMDEFLTLLSPEGDEDYKAFVVPVRGDGNSTRIECLNPKFVTKEEIVNDFKEGVEGINEKFEKILNQFPYKRKVLVEKKIKI